MTKWEVVATRVDAWGGGRREETRARWQGLSCIDAQVIAEELNRAHAVRAGLAQVFAVSLDD